jgi:hypothetical protein
MPINSYPSVCALGHKMIEGIFNNPVLIEEKIDGSQFSFGILDGELQCRSKGKVMILDAPEKMFDKAIATIRDIAPALHPGWIYRGEFLAKPKHNTLAYDRIPKGYIIGFDIQTGIEEYLSPVAKRAEFERLEIECVPAFYEGMVENLSMFKDLLDTVSCLGGSKVEGVVVKNYTMFTAEKKVAMGKYVSEAFKEIHEGEWRKSNPTQSDIVQELIARYRTPARWNKAIQHLRETGKLEGSPRDIGNLILETKDDTKKECEDEIKASLFAHFWPMIQRGIIAGLPEWYKEQLLQGAFGGDE